MRACVCRVDVEAKAGGKDKAEAAQRVAMSEAKALTDKVKNPSPLPSLPSLPSLLPSYRLYCCTLSGCEPTQKTPGP